MSIKTWKKIITVSVVYLLSILLILTLFFGIGYFKYMKKAKSPSVVDLSDYGYAESSELESFLKYLKNAQAGGGLSYQSEYENLYIDNDFDFTPPESGKKVCYLTFDDGPNVDVTPKFLDILKKYGVKATFFVIYRNGEDEKALYKRMVDEGHTLAIHSASHKYTQIYASVEAFLEDFNKVSSQVESVTGFKPEIFRFPGGSINTYNKAVYQQIIAEMTRRGYVYYDRNYSSGDAAGPGISASDIRDNVLKGNSSDTKKIVLCHDGPGHQNTAKALPEIIEGLLEQGYSLEALDNKVSPICFGY